MLLIVDNPAYQRTAVHHAHRMEVQSFGLRRGKHERQGLLGQVRLVERDQRKPFAAAQIQQQLRQFKRRNGSVQNLIRRIVVDLGIARPRRPILFVQIIVEIPRTIHNIGNAARTAQIHRQLEFLRMADRGVKHIVQPGPLEVCRPNGLCLIACQQNRRMPAAGIQFTAQRQNHE